jgi:hypothetical protein
MLRLWRWTNCEIDGKPGTRGIFSCALENKMEISGKIWMQPIPHAAIGSSLGNIRAEYVDHLAAWRRQFHWS